MAGPLGISSTAWWDASAVGGVTLVGSAVSALVDQSGNGRDIAQSTSGSRPTFVAGLFGANPGVSFDGTDDWLGSSGPVMSNLVTSSAFCLVIAMRARAAATSAADADNNDGVYGDVGANMVLSLRDPGTDSFYVMAYDTARRQVSVNVPYSASGLHVVTIWRESNVLNIDVNGVSASIAISGTISLTGALRLGRVSTAGNYAEIDLGEMAWFNTALTGTQRTDLQDYLEAKWTPTLAAGTLHRSVHAVTARPPVIATPLHRSVHPVTATAPSPVIAGTLHRTRHAVTATQASAVVAGTLHRTRHAAPAARPRYVGIGGAIDDTIAFGPRYIEQDSVVVAPLALEVVQRGALSTVISTLPSSFARSFHDPLNDVGSASFSYANTDAAAAAAVLLDRLVTFVVYGLRAFTMLVESMHRVALTSGEEHDQITTVVGRSHLALFEQAIVWPARAPGSMPIEEDRVFNWTSPIFDDSAWGYATEIGTVADAQANYPPAGGSPDSFAANWPDTTDRLIWASSGSLQDAPPGDCYFRRTFTLAVAGNYLLYAVCDNAGEFYIDGVKLIEITTDLPAFTETRTQSIQLSAGVHTLAVHVNNTYDPTNVGYNPGSLVAALWLTDNVGDPTAVVVVTDSEWRIVEYPDHAPGMTPGEVIRVMLEEAQARGVLTDVSLAFDDAVDSGGAGWPEVTDIATKVGTNVLTFLKELTVTYIDVWMQPGSLVLHAWNRGGRGRDSGVVLGPPSDDDDPTSGNIYELTHTVLT